ncbi:hypothetical protein ACFQ9H_19640 [Streptomyces sp. NPDC056517]|uniref:hypothetical protein n=1 Tax=Streptomyces sp. NPDC056517 TaxID=3345848 RepID=UPI003687F12D
MGEPTLVAGQVSIARLHGEACWHCGAVARTLTPAGTIVHIESHQEWPIVACGCVSAPLVARDDSASRPRRHCQFCPESNADACIRTQPSKDGDVHIYAHKACAEARGVRWLYVFTTEPSPGVQR